MLKIGKIVNTHALKGELKIKSFTDFFQQRFKEGITQYIYFENEYIPVIVRKARQHKNLIYVFYENLNHINDVEKYKNCDLFVKREEIHELEEDAYYFHELVGCSVFNDENNLGEVVEVLDYPAQQILVVGKNKMMIPFVEAFVKEVDTKNKKITVQLIEGFA